MEKERKLYARYYIIRGQKALWKGGPAEHDSQYRNIVITSNQFTSTQGKFQIYALEGTGKGIQDGEFAGPENEPQLIFDEDFDGLDAAVGAMHHRTNLRQFAPADRQDASYKERGE